MNEELNGTFALVHPELNDDPAKRQGQIGLITYADPGNDDFYVSFEKGHQGLYSADALLVLNKSNDIYRHAFQYYKELDIADFKNMLEISLLQQSGLRKDAKAAMEMAAASPVIRKLGMTILKDLLGHGLSQGQDNSQEATIGRRS